jgi:hypothetical protein
VPNILVRKEGIKKDDKTEREYYSVVGMILNVSSEKGITGEFHAVRLCVS